MGKIRRMAFFAGTLIFSSLTPGIITAEETAVSSSSQSQAGSLINDYPYYPKFFNETITGIYRAAEQGDFTRAAKTLLEPDGSGTIAMDFMRDAFFSGSHSQSTIARIESGSAKLRKDVQSYIDMQPKISDARKKFLSASQTQEAQSELDKAFAVFSEFAALRKDVIQETAALGTLFDSMKETRKIQDASYLSYLIKFMSGTGRTADTGLTGAMNMQWDALENDLTESLFEKASSASASISKELAKNKILEYKAPAKEISSGIESLKAIVPMLSKITAFTDSLGFEKTSRTYKNAQERKNSADALKEITGKTQTLVSLASQIAADIREIDDFIDKSVADTAQDLRDNLDDVSNFQIQKSNQFADYSNRTANMMHEPWISEFKKNLSEKASLKSFLDAYISTCEFISKTCSTKSSETTVSAGTRLISAGKQMYVEDTEKYQAIMNLIPDASNEDAKQYPSKLLTSISTFKQSMDLDIKTLTKGIELLSTGSLSQSGNIQYMQRKIKESVDNIQKLSSQTDSLVTQAQAQQKEALQAQSQIDIYYNRAKSAFERGDYTAARNNAEKAVELYNSLIDSLKRDAAIQEATYDKIGSLKISIAQQQQPILEQEIRKYKDNARNAYYAGNFEEAYQQISGAEDNMTRWGNFMDMEIEADSELETLKSRINTALEMKSGKELDPNDPLYPEMSQILSISNKYYQTGCSLIEEGKDAEGKKFLNDAKNKLNELKIVYPRNQQANLLSMRIDQKIDLNQFNENFKTKIEELKHVNYTLNDSTAKEAYSDLQDLLALEPKYPGLSDLIFQVEIDLGLRKKAGETKQQTETKQTTTNVMASEVVLLSASDEAKYQQAITYLQSGNVIAAKSNLQELLAKPSNRRSAKIQKLQKRLTDMGY